MRDPLVVTICFLRFILQMRVIIYQKTRTAINYYHALSNFDFPE